MKLIINNGFPDREGHSGNVKSKTRKRMLEGKHLFKEVTSGR